MPLRENPPVPWLTRIMVMVLLLGGGILGAIPFRREAAPLLPATKLTSDNVRLVFRNQDITLQANPQHAESPAKLPPAVVQRPREPLQSSTNPPDLPPRYQSFIVPHSPPKEVPPQTAGRVLEPGEEAATPKVREHVLVDGDSLVRLATRYLGDPNRASEIVALNPVVLADPDTLPIGKVILVPRK